MFSTTFKTLFAASLIGSTLAHMELLEPAPLRGKTNPNSANVVDYDMSAPLAPDGSNYPCKGYLLDVGSSAGAAVASYPAGSTQTFKLGGGAPHGGGSMQASLSFDNGATFKVLKSFVGNAPRNAGNNAPNENQSYEFSIPQDAASGQAIFSWSWFNEIGNREMYQNCAIVSITGSGSSKLDSLPDMFLANIGNGCGTTEGTDLEFPNPGAFVERDTPTSGAQTAAPVGSCQAQQGPAPAPQPNPQPNPQPSPEPSPEDPEDPSEDPEDPSEDPEDPSESVPAPSPSTPANPMPGCNQHVVVKGETCNIIAAQYGTTAAKIMTLNPTINSGCTNLLPGEVLTLRRRSRIMRN